MSMFMKGGIDKGSTATATTGHAVAAGKGEAYYAGSVRCHFRLSTVMMDKDNAHTGYIQKKGPMGTFFRYFNGKPGKFPGGLLFQRRGELLSAQP